MKKAIMIFIVVVLAVVGLFVAIALNSITTIEGYSLSCENGSYMIIEDSGSPICYSYNKAIGSDVKELTNGDRILIISDLINETYPGSTSAYFILKLKDGEVSDIPEETLASLADLGWYKFE